MPDSLIIRSLRFWYEDNFILWQNFRTLIVTCLNFRACVKQCEETGCVGQKCFPHCKFSSDGASINGPWYMQEPLYLQWKKWDCLSDCRYNCMVDREIKRDALGHGPVKYHGKWPFIRVYGIQVCYLPAFYFIENLLLELSSKFRMVEVSRLVTCLLRSLLLWLSPFSTLQCISMVGCHFSSFCTTSCL